ncbi:MAG: tRNA (guanosine(46)-N7)-methyltransferase TrmB [Alphaproteobacteria bacterium]|nr:tRNA (guanosine(46)-N7)-methyltransferase TrmB [Alphaproteobacteria bacterium]MBV8336889.1 tRNA (guanosine(46)-N7)-methyltransferase TrmB [Alphaproteobacteria bacterium]
MIFVDHQPPRRQLIFGRRRGRVLRPGQKRLIRELLPRVLLTIPPSACLQQATEVPVAGRPVWLEIGFGAGEHLAAQAECHREINFIGCDVFENGIAKLLERIERRRLDNIRVFNQDARLLIETMPTASVDRVFILFPDPWPKRRHAKRRIISRDTLDSLAAIMKDGAELRVATDDRDYVCWIIERLTNHPAFEWLARRRTDWRERPADWPPTRYEEKALAAGRLPVFFRSRRRARN